MPEEQRIAVPTDFDPEDEYRPEPEPEPLPPAWMDGRSEEHTSELQSRLHLVCRLLLEKKNNDRTLPQYPKRSDWSIETSNNEVSVATCGGVEVIVSRPF